MDKIGEMGNMRFVGGIRQDGPHNSSENGRIEQIICIEMLRCRLPPKSRHYQLFGSLCLPKFGMTHVITQYFLLLTIYTWIAFPFFSSTIFTLIFIGTSFWRYPCITRNCFLFLSTFVSECPRIFTATLIYSLICRWLDIWFICF